ncbi:MAG: peptidase M14 [Anaerolineae bacterium]|nr:peptidase M14 [Anaerolineae bacterium]
MVDIDFGEYFQYSELTAHLQALAAAFPALASLESLGKSWQGRDIWAMTLTNQATGPAADKPAFYIDAHIHAEEVATSHTALYTVWYLLTRYGEDPEVTWLLDHTAFYILPRVNPDGAEISLTTGHHWCGNGRYLPGEEQARGLCQQDINGDGLIVQMRLEDPAGEWRISEDDPRLMVLREPGETGGGPYYRLFREGVIKGEWDGVSFEIEKPRDGNLNRNYPAGWVSEVRQYGAGEYPLSEPEALAVARFLLDHPNISGMQCYHTHGGVHLRPSLVAPDSAIPRADLALYKTLGAMATSITGYPTISVYEEFTPDPSQARTGSLMQWSYDEMGIVTFSTELWNPELAAGIENPAFYQVRGRSREDELKLLAYNDEHLGGKGFVNWTPFDHPQLGPAEIGGWTHMYTFRNPPPASFATTEKARGFLRETIHNNCLFTLRHAACTPLVRIASTTVEPLGGGLYKLSAVVRNEGYLPTYMTERALERETVTPVTVTLDVPEGVELVMGAAAQEIGHLAGRDERTATWSPWLHQWHSTARAAEWLVRAAEAALLTITAESRRAGVHRAEAEVG